MTEVEHLLDSALAADIHNALGWGNSSPWGMRGHVSLAPGKIKLAIPETSSPSEHESSAKYRVVTVPNTMSANQNISNWPGDFGFSVRFDKEPKTGKNMTWTYSDPQQKLYVSMNGFFPIHFATERLPPRGSVVCVVAAYRDSNFRRVNVERCPVHADLTHNSNKLTSGTHPYPEHWIRCDHPSTKYCRDIQNGGRHCLCLPLETPEPISNHLFTYRLAFMCHNSCTGGPSRRSTDVIFILQSPDGKDIARRVLEVKVCACPGRDRRRDEESQKGETSSPSEQSAKKVLCVPQSSTNWRPSPELPTKKRKRSLVRHDLPLPSSMSYSAELPISKPSFVPQPRASCVRQHPVKQVLTEPSSSARPCGSDVDDGPPYIVTFDSRWSRLAYELLRPIHEVLEFKETVFSREPAETSGGFTALLDQVE